MSIKVEMGQFKINEVNPSERVTTIEAGQKRLTLALLPFGRASARIDNISGRKRIDGETTAVFSAAKGVLEKEANSSGQPIQFEIESSWDSMTGWMKTAGKDLFGWDLRGSADDPHKLVAEVEIYPR